MPKDNFLGKAYYNKPDSNSRTLAWSWEKPESVCSVKRTFYRQDIYIFFKYLDDYDTAVYPNIFYDGWGCPKCKQATAIEIQITNPDYIHLRCHCCGYIGDW